jgi:hypothetical protein
MDNVRFPQVHVNLVGEDGNAFSILGRVRRAMHDADVAQEDIDAYHQEATSGDYNYLLEVTMRTVSCDSDDEDDISNDDMWDDDYLDEEDEEDSEEEE